MIPILTLGLHGHMYMVHMHQHACTYIHVQTTHICIYAHHIHMKTWWEAIVHLSNKDLEENGKPGGKYRIVYFVDQKSQLRR